MVEIRRAVPGDIERICQITKVAWGEATLYKLMEERHGVVGGKPWWQHKVDDLKRQCQQSLENIFVAVENRQVVGYATYSIDVENGIGHVLNNAVAPGFQGRGIGTALVGHVLGLFREKGLRIARVVTLEHDLPARRVYEKHGFKELAKSVHYTMKL